MISHIVTIGADTKQGICEVTLKPQNPQIEKDCKYFMSIPVWEVLTKNKGLITIDPKTKIVSPSIDLTTSQKAELKTICEALK